MKKRCTPRSGSPVNDPVHAENKAQDSSVAADEQEALLRYLNAVLGIDGAKLAAGLLRQVITFCSNGAHFDNERYKFIVASLVTAKPRNHVQAMLTQQLATMHILYMKYAKLALDPENPVQAELVIGILSKIARGFVSQCDALYRSQEGPILEAVIQSGPEPAPEAREHPKASEDADGARTVASDTSVVPPREGSALRQRSNSNRQ